MPNIEEIIQEIENADQPDLVIDKIQWDEKLGSNIEIQKALAKAIMFGDDASESYRILRTISKIESLVGSLHILEAVGHKAGKIGGGSTLGYEGGEELRDEIDAKLLLKTWIDAISKFDTLTNDQQIQKIITKWKRSIRK
ncbi:MAG: hypothetical protein GPJ52_00395 [Candidatus Heimdallarchaeota archaeon]|nr:hypothetical protein [Candidatus Heimdallarchaeota archaeon]